MKMYSLYKQCSGNFLLSDLKLSSLKMAFFLVISILNDCYPQIPANTAGNLLQLEETFVNYSCDIQLTSVGQFFFFN